MVCVAENGKEYDDGTCVGNETANDIHGEGAEKHTGRFISCQLSIYRLINVLTYTHSPLLVYW